MKETISDKVVDRLHKRRDMVQNALEKQYKKTKPFRMEPVSEKEMLIYYNMLSNEDMQFLVDKHGNDAINEMIYKYEKMKQEAGNG